MVFTVSSLLNNRLPGNIVTSLFGKWITTPNGASYPVGGLVYYMTPPSTWSALFTDPVHLIIYVTYVMASCSLFSYFWLDISGSGVKDVAKSLNDQGLVVVGYRPH